MLKPLFALTSVWLIGPGLFIIPIIMLLDLWRKKRRESLIILLAFLVTAVTAIRDLHYDRIYTPAGPVVASYRVYDHWKLALSLC